MINKSELLLYQTEDGQTKIDVCLEEESNVPILHISGSDSPVKFYNLDVCNRRGIK